MSQVRLKVKPRATLNIQAELVDWIAVVLPSWVLVDEDILQYVPDQKAEQVQNNACDPERGGRKW